MKKTFCVCVFFPINSKDCFHVIIRDISFQLVTETQLCRYCEIITGTISCWLMVVKQFNDVM